MANDLKARLGVLWRRHLVEVPEHWLIDWAVAANEASGARVTAVAAHVRVEAPMKGQAAVLVATPVWVALRDLSDRLRVPHILVAEFDDTVLYRVWPPVSGIHYESKAIEDFIMTSIQLEPEGWKAVP